ncbi:MAG: ATP-binding protein [Ruminococcaceae bacterium]|nr:ATP-binding protein [Oscillospiraceae bacterium]
MSFSDEVYEAARQKLAERRKAAEDSCERLRREIYLKLPQIREIDAQMMGDAVKIIEYARMALSGEDTSSKAEFLKEKNLARQRQRAEILRKNGYPADAPTPRYVCGKCEDTGYVGTRRCECHEALLRAEAAARITGASMLMECSFENFSLDYYSDKSIPPQNIVPREIMTRVFGICRDYAENFSGRSGNLLMIGGTGLGKTHLSMAIARRVIEKGQGVVYCSAYNIFAQLQKEQYARGDDTLSGIMDCDLLILDDLGSEVVNQFSVAQVNSIVNSRIISGKPTIINTNFSVNELEKLYTERFISRIIGSYRRLSFVGKDVRLLMASQNEKR